MLLIIVTQHAPDLSNLTTLLPNQSFTFAVLIFQPGVTRINSQRDKREREQRREREQANVAIEMVSLSKVCRTIARPLEMAQWANGVISGPRESLFLPHCQLQWPWNLFVLFGLDYIWMCLFFLLRNENDWVVVAVCKARVLGQTFFCACVHFYLSQIFTHLSL